MALPLDTIRAIADRVAAAHGLEVVDVEFSGGGKHRALRLFIEKNEEERRKIVEAASHTNSEEPRSEEPGQEAAAVAEAILPKGVPVEALSCVTHEDCAGFARDFETVLDVEDLVPGSEYTLEVSSPGLERKLRSAADYQRFQASLVQLQTFSPIEGNRHFTGRLTAFDGHQLTIDLSAVKQKGKRKKTLTQTVTIELANIEKANLVVEI